MSTIMEIGSGQTTPALTNPTGSPVSLTVESTTYYVGRGGGESKKCFIPRNIILVNWVKLLNVEPWGPSLSDGEQNYGQKKAMFGHIWQYLALDGPSCPIFWFQGANYNWPITVFGCIWVFCWPRQIWLSGVSLKRSYKMEFRHIDLRTIGRPNKNIARIANAVQVTICLLMSTNV